jgi:hypothetical protein
MSRSFIIDMKDPFTQIQINGDAGRERWFLSPVSVEIEASDGNSGVKGSYYRVVGGSWEEYKNPIKFSKDGKFIIEYHSEDLAGHTEIIRDRLIKIDTISPETEIELEGEEGKNSYFLGDVKVELLSSDKTSGVGSTFWKLDENRLRGYSEPVVISSSGSHIFTYYSVDIAGNVEQKRTVIIQIDLEIPVMRIVEPLNLKILNFTGLTLHPIGLDPDGHEFGFQYSLDKGDWIGCGEVLELSDLSEGKHILLIRIEDISGRSSTSRYEFGVNTSYGANGPLELLVDEPSEDDGSMGYFLAVVIVICILGVLGGLGLFIFLIKRSP